MNKLPSKSPKQRQRLLEALQKRPYNTFDARESLDIPHPAARVQELREQGHNIITYRRAVETDKGRHNKVAEYVLLNEGGA